MSCDRIRAMLSNLALELTTFFEKSHTLLVPWSFGIGGLWLFNIVNWISGSHLNHLGIVPRRLSGLMGVLFCPLLHQNFNHLFFNSIPLFVLGLMLLASGTEVFFWATGSITLLGGLLVWLLGRRANHIGASGLISGYFGFIIVMAYFNPSAVTLILAGIVLYYFGGIFLGIFPQEAKVSWESHLYGFLSGLLSAWLPHYLHWDQLLPQ